MKNEEAKREFWARYDKELFLGHRVDGPGDFYLPLKDLKETSVHILGASGVGKSYFLRQIIDQLVKQRQAFGLLDPHTELYDYAQWRLRRSGVRRERMVLLDPSDSRYAVGFNPLNCGLTDPGDIASMVLDAFLKAWGATSFDNTPRLEGMLRGMLRVLIENDLTLLEGYDFLNVDNKALRSALLKRVSDRYVREDWLAFEQLSRTDKQAFVESTRNRLRRVVQASSMQLMLAQTGQALDLRKVMDDGQFLLVNLGGVSASETQRLVGALLVNGIYQGAKMRNSRRRRDWFLIADEFGQYVSKDFANSLDQLRKFGCHLIMAHQRLQQLIREDPDVMSAVMTNARIKVVFGGLERPEAERVGKEIFTGEARGDCVKHVTIQTKFRPVFDTYDVEGESSSDSESDSETWGHSEGATSNLSATEGDGSTNRADTSSGSRGSTATTS